MPPIQQNGYQAPFSEPLFSIPSASVSSLLFILFLLVFAAWAAYAVVAGYHWFRYGHRSLLALPAMAGYVLVSGIFIILMASGI